LDFAGRWFGQVRYDLASSGVQPIPARELPLGDPRAVDEFGAHGRFAAAVARRYAVPEHEVVPCLGASGALHAAYTALLPRGARVLVERPVYEPLWRVAEGLGYDVDFFERTPEAGYAVAVDAVLAALRPETRLVVLSNPHNPSGAVCDDDRLIELAAELDARGAWLLVDEVYLELFRPRATARTLHQNVITCSSATKCWGVPWARAGWLLVPTALCPLLERAERHALGRAPPACWVWGESAVAAADALLDRAHRLQADKREIVDRFMAERAASLDWHVSGRGALFGFVRHKLGRSLTLVLEQGIESRGVLVALGAFFGDETGFRLSFTAASDALRAGLAELGELLEAAR
jgi:aspartate/methionine/tyrosine aminotransferase